MERQFQAAGNDCEAGVQARLPRFRGSEMVVHAGGWLAWRRYCAEAATTTLSELNGKRRHHRHIHSWRWS